jgi:hypothetical protein
MNPFRGVRSVCALIVLAAVPGPARAAWDNVFQVCCFGCRNRPAVSNYAAPNPCCNPCPPPQPVCTTRYVQRCYYQPVTCYQTRSYYQQVTTYRTSYYYEPVTSYRYSCYYDPCTCRYQQVACPTTCYRLRSQCCPVTNWVQRCCQVPVTSYRIASYWEPVTSCCTPQAPSCYPTAASAAPCAPNGTAAASPYPSGTQPPAGVTEQRIAPVPGVSEQRTPTGTGSPLYDRYYPPPQNPPPYMPGVGRSVPPPPPAPPTVRLDRIVSVPSTDLNRQVVATNDAPAARVRLLTVSVTR